MASRRRFLQTAAAFGAASSLAAAPKYQLGCETLPYRSFPLERALEGIRKAGYRYVMPYHTHAGKVVFGPSLTSAERASVRRKFEEQSLQVFMVFIGLDNESRLPGGLKGYLAELDFFAEMGIRTAVGVGPWYFTRFPNLPKRDRDWQKEVDQYYRALEPAVRHAEKLGVTIALKPHTGITARGKDCLEVMRRLPSPRLKICWDAGNVSFYEGVHPDPDLVDLAPHVKAVCIKDHSGLRGEGNFPPPGEGQIDHELMFKTLFGGGFNGPMALERVDGRDNAAKMPAELIDQRIAAAQRFLTGMLEKSV
ncbi:MAG: sugar phosphate isomerase/epimerase [Bryobacteraceae bacterium]|nr:sugar phosphate isomerase/epimerase [Bryobacterales bacterium]NUN02226.1 sugar phosphate isomerase/epimerase [Bryobacteraceae bacterium]